MIQVKIGDWPFKALSNKLVVTMESKGQTDEDECVALTTGEDKSDSLRWFNFDLNGAVLYHIFF